MMSKAALVLLAVVALCGIAPAAEAQSAAVIPLAGNWRFSLDAADAGGRELWFQHNLADQARLPGSLAEEGIGTPPSSQTKWTARIGVSLLNDPKYLPYQLPGKFQTPFWLTPPAYYVGAAWYQRDIEIPAGWTNKRVVLFLERAHWETSVWLDDHAIGTQNSLGTPHVYGLTQLAAPGRHRLTVRVDNTVKIPVGLDAHSISDQTQGNWNGIVGRIELQATDKVWIDNVQAYPDVAAKKVRLKISIGNLSGQAGNGSLAVTSTNPSVYAVKWDASGGVAEISYDLGPNAKTWDEFSPAVYHLTVQLNSHDGKFADQREITVGLRELGVKGTQFILNGRPIFLRGTLECCIFPLTGYPPTDVAAWERIMTIAKSYGLNHIRFHSWCPPEEAFAAADETGFYLSVECSCWATAFGKPLLDDWVSAEAGRMLKAYGNHPSFMFMVPSNEPNRQDTSGFLNEIIGKWQAEDSRHLYTAGSGWPVVKNNQYRVASAPRIQGSHELARPPRTNADYHEFIAANPLPVVSHEIGQWCAYPDFSEIPKFSGVMKAGNLHIFSDFLTKAGMADQAHGFLTATGKFQALLYKEDIEAALRTRGMAGFQLLDLHDFPGQGTPPVGVLDAFWDSKGYITAREYHRFCGSTVPLARMDKRIFTSDETFSADIDVAHFGEAAIENAPIIWRLRDGGGKILGQGTLAAVTIPTGTQTRLGTVNIPLSDLPALAKMNLEVSVGSDAVNDWDFWVYPAKVDDAPPAGVRIATALDADALAYLNGGGKLLLLPGPAGIAGNTFGSFQPIFWNRITFPSAKVHTVGILCDPAHPALAEFPTDSYTNWQWWDLLQNCKPMILDSFPRQARPIVQVIDDWNVCRKLGLVAEARVGGGKLLICSIDLQKDMDSRPVARQMRRSLLDYMGGSAFAPTVDLSILQIKELLGAAPVN